MMEMLFCLSEETFSLHFKGRSTVQTEQFGCLAFIAARFTQRLFNVMTAHFIKNVIQIEIPAQRKRQNITLLLRKRVFSENLNNIVRLNGVPFTKESRLHDDIVKLPDIARP